MIELFARLSAEGDIDQLWGRARSASREQPDRAIELLLSALLHTHAREESYAGVTQLLARLFASRGDARMALSASWYAGNPDEQRRLFDAVPVIDRARTRAHWADTEAARASEHFRTAAAELEGEGLLARAAIYYERAEDNAAARTLWARLAQLLEGQETDAYVAGLALFNQARTSHALGDETAGRAATVAAVHRLEEAADRFEAIGQRERAFDCYHVLVAVGRLGGEFEHVLEGSVNAIRILTEDNLRYHALRLYEHAIRLAESAKELSAAATLAREMTEHARLQGMTRLARVCTMRQAALWQQVARSNVERGGPAQLSENAYLASVLAAAEADQYASVGEVFGQLAQLDIEPARRTHYARASRRYHDATNARLDTNVAEEHLGEHVAPPDVWHVDLLEWEGRGSAVEACADVMLDPEGWDDRITRRSVLLARLAALAAEQEPESAEDGGAMVAGYLAPVGLYELLSPLERLAASGNPAVRLAAVRALSRYFYKRTFVTLERALVDPSDQVVDEASAAIERLRFDHAFDPLARIFRTSTSAKARLAALKALARIDVAEAAELVLGVLDHGGPEEQQAAIVLLRAGRGDQFLGAARAVYPGASPRLRRAIEDVFRHRGASL